MDTNTINILVLAYLGDSVYELYIREYLINKRINKANDLQTEAIKYVSANGQSRYLHSLIEDEILNEAEIDIVKRARNNKGTAHPRNTDILTYKHATALEALIGYLYLKNNVSRIKEIINYITKEK